MKKFKKSQLLCAGGYGMKYYTRLEVFKGNAGKCIFNPKTGEAWSYDWYALAKRIKGVQVLNTYTYSNQTAKHIGKVRAVMGELGIKYAEIQAPRGLQDLEASRKHHVEELGAALVEYKYARIKTKSNIRYHERALKLLNKLGFKHKVRDIKLAVETAEADRLNRNEEMRFKSRARKLTNYLENVVAFRDYDIVDARHFGNPNHHMSRKVAVHQVVDMCSLEHDVENALHSFQRDGFGCIVFYIGGAK